LGAPGICTLTLSGNLTLWPVGVFRDDDLFVWRSDWRKPLSVAARVAKHWGVADPYDLAMPPLQLQRQLWEVLSASERHPEAPGWCTWCRADIVSGEPHADHCLPNNLYATHVPGVFSRPLLPKPARRGMRTPGIKAYGIKKLREGREWRQQDVAQRLGIDTNYFARIERADLALTNAKAKQIAELFDVHVDEVYGHEPDRPDPT
jgi:DNA-binding XRE family transcriptional regulator